MEGAVSKEAAPSGFDLLICFFLQDSPPFRKMEWKQGNIETAFFYEIPVRSGRAALENGSIRMQRRRGGHPWT
jgi:hypothetical protein